MKKIKKPLKIGIPILAVCIVFAIVLTSVVIPIGKFGKEKWSAYHKLKVGDTYTFGAYEQDNDQKNGKEAIEWIILDKNQKDGLSLLLVSKQTLDCQKYNNDSPAEEGRLEDPYTDDKVIWKDASLRTWLNDTFLNEAFTSAEQEKIQNTEVFTKIESGYWHHTNSGVTTTDRIFLLSGDEVRKYFSSNDARLCAPTDYAIAQGAYTSDDYTSGGKAACWWWLRTPGGGYVEAEVVFDDGHILLGGDPVDGNDVYVRPAMWIDISGTEG